MDISRRNLIKLSGITAVSLAINGCNDGGNGHKSTIEVLTVTIDTTDALVPHETDRILLKFNKPIDHRTVHENIYLSDKTGGLMHMHTAALDFEDVSHQSVQVNLKENIHLNESWKYSITVTDQVRSISGESLSTPVSLEFTTTSKHPFVSTVAEDVNRTKIVVISDLHMNEQRGFDDGYSLFTENGKLLEEFLEYVRTSEQIKELVILGDLLDMWLVPMTYDTFHDTVTDAKEYFQSVADAAVNKEVIAKINQIADEGNIRFSYVPGNHDMLFTEEIFDTIFPNGFWQGVEPGTGAYYPESNVALEHGHNYDLFNAPDQITTEGSILPPGYFITRVYATGNLLHTKKSLIETPPPASEDQTQEFLYELGWTLAVTSINIPDFDQDKPQIVTGVDKYTELYSPNGARDIYSKTIGPDWKQRQIQNGVYQPEPFLTAEMNGSGKFWWFGTLELSAIIQYFIPQRAKIVVFGHTHQAMIRKNLLTTYKIYANSGTWVDSNYLNDDALTGTCVILNTSGSSGSDLDNVTVYQAVEDQDKNLILKKVGEENLDTTLVS